MSMTFCHFFHINAAFSYKKNEKMTFLPHLAHRMPCRLRHCRKLYMPQPPNHGYIGVCADFHINNRKNPPPL